jgi:succinate dehydrogenase / fumarate reductase, cytochrome b subunit
MAQSSRPSGSLYRGGQGMWSWVAHRITGVLVFFFLFAHILETALLRVSPNSYDKVVDIYRNPFVNLLELGLVGAVVYHVLNGVRIMLVDFWSAGAKYHKHMLVVVLAIWVTVMVPSAYFMLEHAAKQLFGSS